ncbi:MAG: hypothetical protein E7324_04405 [Clostridiales bacterium]|nr:hypothetical protein [Clostridiales bacterium]
MKNNLVKILMLLMAMIGLIGLCSSALADVVVNVQLEEASGGGDLQEVEGGLHFVGGANSWVNTKHMLNQNMGDFEWKFDYTVARHDWSDNCFMFRSQWENNMYSYRLQIKGRSAVSSGQPALSLVKGQGVGAEEVLATTSAVNIENDKAYTFRIVMVGADIEVYVDTEGGTSTTPVLTATVPSNGEDFYGDADALIKEGNFQITAWDSDFVISNMTFTVPQQKPEGEPTLLDTITHDGAGIVEKKADGSVRMAGKSAAGGDAMLNTNHILGSYMSDFDWSFEYTPSIMGWNQDIFAFRSQNENEWGCYELRIRGANVAGDGANIVLHKGENNAIDTPIASTTFEGLNPDQTYSVRILVEDDYVKVFFAVKGQESDTPTLEGALPNVGGNYNTELVPEGDFQILSWAGDFVISNMTIGLPSQDVEPEPEILPIGYLNNTVCPLGVTLRDLDNPVTGKWYTVLPLDLSQDCTYVYPLIGGNVYVIGEVRITVAAGTVTVDYEYYNLSYMHEWPTEVLGEHLNFFGDISTVTKEAVENQPDSGFEFGVPYSIEKDLGGDTEVLLFICNRVNFYDFNPCIYRFYKEAYRSYINAMTAQLAAMAQDGNVIAPAPYVEEEDASYTKGAVTNLLPLIEKEAGEFVALENGLRVKGTTDAGDQYCNSWHILQRHVADFELEFDYTPSKNEWNADRISFRCEEPENEWGQYMVLIGGSKTEHAGISLVKGEALKQPFAKADYALELGVTYNFKLIAKGNVLKLYVCEAGEEFGRPLLTATLSTEPTDNYRDIYIPAGDFQIVTWGGDFVMTYMNVTELEKVAE